MIVIHRIGCFAFNFKSRICVFKMTHIQTCQNDSILVCQFFYIVNGNKRCEPSYKMLRIQQEYMFLIIVNRLSTNKLYSKQCLFINLINYVYRLKFTPWLKRNVL